MYHIPTIVNVSILFDFGEYTMDAFDVATQAAERRNHYYGKMEVSASFIQLRKGVGKLPWTESDDIKDRRVEMRIVLNPIDAMGLTVLLERNIIAESKDWGQIVWPSLRDLGMKNARELHGKFARIEFVETGRVYTSKRGDTQKETTFRFTALFNTAAEATAAYWQERGGAEDGDPMVVDMSAKPATVDNSERATALQFLPPLVKSAAGDRAKLATMIAGVPMISRHFTVDSPEVAMLLAAVA